MSAMPPTTRPNRFSFCHADGRLEPVESAAGIERFFGEYEYITQIIRSADEAAAGRGIHFVVTWGGNLMPPLNPTETVLLVVGDERGQVPNGVNSAGLVFRTGSPKSPWPVMQWRQRPMTLFLLASLREARNAGLRFKRWAGGQAPLRTPPYVESVPIGFVGSTPLEPVAMGLREWDLSFAGGAGAHRILGGRRVPTCPKAAARIPMLEALNTLQAAKPELKMRIVCPGFGPGELLARDAYFGLLQQTKISLCPRGNFVETFRMFESARLGCVVVTDRLPAGWYFENAPFIQLDDWRKLAPVAGKLLADPAELKSRGEAALKWWHETASPKAVGSRIAGKIQRL